MRPVGSVFNGGGCVTRYWKYIKAGGKFTFFATVMMYVISQLFSLVAPLVVSYWTRDLDYVDHSMGFYMMLYALAGVGAAVFAFFRTFALVGFGVRASTTMHNNLLHSILRAPLSFFDTTPTGRIVSRFSKARRRVGATTVSAPNLAAVW